MRVSRTFTLACLVPSVLAACGQNHSVTACATPANNSKVQLEDSPELSKSSASDKIYPAGSRLIAVLRDECPAPGRIAALVPDRFEGVTKSGVRSYNLELPLALSVRDLTRMAEEDPCVEMISNAAAEEIASQDVPQNATLSMAEDEVSMPEALPNDPGISRARHLNAIGASAAYDVFYHPQTGIKKDVVIAVIDSGVVLSHEDLKSNLWVNRDEIPGNGKDDDRNGYKDDVNGYNMASRKANPSPERTSANGSWQWAHGTRVAGLAAAVASNGRGAAGVAGKAKIMVLNNLGRDQYMDQVDTTNAIRYAVDNGADVINLSLGGSAASAAYKAALRYAVSKGVVVLAAAGNESRRIGSTYSAAGVAASLPGLISIGNFQADNFLRSPTSNYSTTYVELGAPGTNSTRSLLYTTDAYSSKSYGYFSGTSAAVPVAAGGAALAVGLIKSRGYNVSAAQIENLMLQSAKKKSTLKNYFRDGNALDLAGLAKLIDSKYPAKRIMLGGTEPEPENRDVSAPGDCPAI